MEGDLAQLHERLFILLNQLVEILNEHESRISMIEDDNVKKEISFYAKKLGISESEFLKNVADFIKKYDLRIE
ncbi:MAG: hypothetical protein N3F64_01330 [Nitrososphaeria archaeon]|nr:hypothetical protein [Nitrososphaeria archaeon]